jgi:hypothetical protein
VNTRRRRSREECLDLLPAPGESALETWNAVLIVDPSAQLKEVTDLSRRGLLSPEEFERQRRKVAKG